MNNNFLSGNKERASLRNSEISEIQYLRIALHECRVQRWASEPTPGRCRPHGSLKVGLPELSHPEKALLRKLLDTDCEYLILCINHGFHSSVITSKCTLSCIFDPSCKWQSEKVPGLNLSMVKLSFEPSSDPKAFPYCSNYTTLPRLCMNVCPAFWTIVPHIWGPDLWHQKDLECLLKFSS